uniref:DDE-1 domain-containing protein n=1 Tax=Callorhinchus milii TaxID=7868 RepID=A0A4W3KJL5_CALMI
MNPRTYLTWMNLVYSGGKKSNGRIIMSLTVNMEGDIKWTVVIGKPTKSHAFRNLNIKTQLPITWYSNKKAWMTSAIFTEWLQTFNRKMSAQGRYVLLFLDNTTSHPHSISTLNQCQVSAFPANTISILQLLVQHLIQNVKLLHSTGGVFYVGVQASQVAKFIIVLCAVTCIHSAVNTVCRSTVLKCFAKAGFSIDEPDDVPLDLNEGWEERFVEEFLPGTRDTKE